MSVVIARHRPTLRRRLSVVVLVALAAGGCAASSGPARGPLRGSITLATGGTQGVYFQYGQALRRAMHTAAPGLDVRVLPTTGSIQNLLMVAADQSTCAFTASDAAAEALSGRSPFPRPLALTAVARVYDDYLHLVTTRDSGINALSDLRSRTVSTGPPGSGTRLIVDRLFDVAGIGSDQVDGVELGINESIEALEDGTIDAFFWSGGVPTSGVAELAERVPLQLVPVADLVPSLRSQYEDVYRLASIPTGTYGLQHGVSTLAVPNSIVCSAGVPAAVVDLIVSTLFDARDKMSVTVPQVSSLDRRAAIETNPVPLNPAAAQWFRRMKP